MIMIHTLARLVNPLYHLFPGIYRPMYSLYKKLSDVPERQLMRSFVRPGMTVVDVGANIGTTTELLAGLVGPQGLIFSFEPEEQNFERLLRAVSRLRNVRPVQIAVADTTGEITLYVANDLNVDHRTYDTGEGRRAIPRHATRLDDYFPPGTKIGFLKMDIQGFELHALRGAERILSENREIGLLLEYWPYGLLRAGVRPAELLEFLGRHRFSVQVVGKRVKGGLPAVGEGEDDYLNVFASRAD
jgi:FkbM family methyltransferase